MATVWHPGEHGVREQVVAVDRGTSGAAPVLPGRRSLRRLRLVTVLAPTALVLVVAGPGIAGMEALPVPRELAQPVFAGLGAVAAFVAIYLADGCDDLQTIPEQNLRLLMLLLSMIAVAIGGAWLWLGTMNLVHWLLAAA